MTNQINQQSKSNTEGKAVLSLILGLIGSLMWYPFLIIFGGILRWVLTAFQVAIIGSILLLIPIMGLLFGVQGKKSTKKKMALVGIVFSTVGLIGGILDILYFLYLLGYF